MESRVMWWCLILPHNKRCSFSPMQPTLNKSSNFMGWIQSKPEAYRKRFSFFVALGITGIIFIFWLISIRLYFKEQSMSEAAIRAREEGSVSSHIEASASRFEVSPIKSLISDIKEGFNALSELREPEQSPQ